MSRELTGDLLGDLPKDQHDGGKAFREEQLSRWENFPKPQPTRFKTQIDPRTIILNAGTQSRDRTDRKTVGRYAELMNNRQWDFEREPLPVVFRDPASGEIYASDCHHRTEAAIKAGIDKIWVELRSGTLVDAILHSCGANTMHGLPLRPKDQRKRIELFLDTCDLLPEGDKRKSWSNRDIADYLGLAESAYKTVGNIIKEREMAALISQFKKGDRVLVHSAVAYSNGSHCPKGVMGVVQDLNEKKGKGVLFIPDRDAVNKDGQKLPSSIWIHPDNLKHSVEEELPENEAPRPVDDQATEDTCEKICTVLIKTQSQPETTHAHRVAQLKAEIASFREKLAALEADLESGSVLDVSLIVFVPTVPDGSLTIPDANLTAKTPAADESDANNGF